MGRPPRSQGLWGAPRAPATAQPGGRAPPRPGGNPNLDLQTPDLRSPRSPNYNQILDEGHKIKSESTLVSQGVRAIQRQHTLLLTGTPLQNNLVGEWRLGLGLGEGVGG
jgi:hypothetical protein